MDAYKHARRLYGQGEPRGLVGSVIDRSGASPLELSSVRSWRQFRAQVRRHGCNLLSSLGDYPSSVLVAGCQRSGTTALTRVISQSSGMVDYWTNKDDELDAALILSGCVRYLEPGRYCFQTTYLNECYQEYNRADRSHKLLWVIRNPYSVIRSMLYNWGRFAFDELFRACGAPLLDGRRNILYQALGGHALPRLTRACLSYKGKLSQVPELMSSLGPDRMAVIDYDELVKNSSAMLPRIYDFINLPYASEYGRILHSRSVGKANDLSASQCAYVKSVCEASYRRCGGFRLRPDSQI